MLIHLIHNPQAGLVTQETQLLLQKISEVGHQVTPFTLSDDFVDKPCDMIAVAGGDGTLEAIVRRFYNDSTNSAVPLLIIPQGTANNIANSLNVSTDIRASLQFAQDIAGTPQSTDSLTVGELISPNGRRLFVESVGCGLVTKLIQTDHHKSKSQLSTQRGNQDLLRHQISLLIDLIDTFEAPQYHLVIDGINYSGRYLLIEIMNIAQIGPGIPLAPGKDPSNDTAEVVFIGSGQKEDLKNFLRAVGRGTATPYPFTRITGKHIQITCAPSDLHVDDTPFTGEQHTEFSVNAGVQNVTIANSSAINRTH